MTKRLKSIASVVVLFFAIPSYSLITNMLNDSSDLSVGIGFALIGLLIVGIVASIITLCKAIGRYMLKKIASQI